MFNKLSFDELAKFYGGLADLERHYGKDEVMAAVEKMDEQLRSTSVSKPKVTFDGKDLSELVLTTQMELIPEDKPRVKRKNKRDYNGRKPVGMNKQLIEKWCNENYPGLTTAHAMLYLYYEDGLTQKEIGEKIGVCQRAVGQYLNSISEKRKRKIMAGREKA